MKIFRAFVALALLSLGVAEEMSDASTDMGIAEETFDAAYEMDTTDELLDSTIDESNRKLPYYKPCCPCNGKGRYYYGYGDNYYGWRGGKRGKRGYPGCRICPCRTPNPTPNPTPRPCTSRVGDTVYRDLNGDGIQDFNEPGIGGVTLTLFRTDSSNNDDDDYYRYGGDRYSDRDYRYDNNRYDDGRYSGGGYDSGRVVSTTVTDGSGYYIFSGLCEGRYCIRVTDYNNQLNGLVATGPQVSVSCFYLNGDSDRLDQDFGYYKKHLPCCPCHRPPRPYYPFPAGKRGKRGPYPAPFSAPFSGKRGGYSWRGRELESTESVELTENVEEHDENSSSDGERELQNWYGSNWYGSDWYGSSWYGTGYYNNNNNYGYGYGYGYNNYGYGKGKGNYPGRQCRPCRCPGPAPYGPAPYAPYSYPYPSGKRGKRGGGKRGPYPSGKRGPYPAPSAPYSGKGKGYYPYW